MSRTRASSRCSRQSDSSGSSARCSDDRQVRPIEVGRLEQDVEVADRTEPRGDLAQAVPVALGPTRPERRAEDAPGRALPTGRDAHRVELLRVDAGARAGLAREHPREVEAHDLAPRLGDVILGVHSRRPADDEAHVRRDRLVDRLR